MCYDMLIGGYLPSPNIDSQTVHLYYATYAETWTGLQEESEQINEVSWGFYSVPRKIWDCENLERN